LKRFEFELLWEVGSGHGNVAIPLQSNGIAVIGIEPLLNGAKITAGSGVRTYLGTLESLNLPSNSISVIGAFDVLEHLENPVVLLSEMYRVLEPGGLLLVSVPAHKWLFSDFDESIGHHRRYSRKDLSQQLQQSGFLDRRFEFMFSIFVPPAYILRKLPSLFGRSRNANSTTRSYRNQSKIIDALEPTLMPFLYLERLLHLPFGLSLFGVCKK
jgi:SAM-dependent methyltransferase